MSPFLLKRKNVNKVSTERDRINQQFADAKRAQAAKIKASKNNEEQQIADAERKSIALEQLAEKKRQLTLLPLVEILEKNYLKADQYYKEHIQHLVSQQHYNQLRINFIKSWLTKHLPPSDKAVKLDDEQALAVATVNGNIQILARAGSGKTTTLVLRAYFLIKHCGVHPQELLLLAFNKKAAQEVRKKLLLLLYPSAAQHVQQKLKENKQINKRDTTDQRESKVIEHIVQEANLLLPYTFTFHALAYAIVHPEEPPLHDSENTPLLSSLTQGIIDDYLRNDNYRYAIRNLMMAHFKEDWQKIITGGFEQNREDFLNYRRLLPQLSLKGEYVKSYGEKLIADFLFEHDIDYKYERNHYWSGINYRPDFTLFTTAKSGVIIEYFGLEGDPDYDESSQQKQQYWTNKKNWQLLTYNPTDITSQGSQHFLNTLTEHLKSHGFTCNKLPDEEIWQRCKKRAIDRFTKAMVAFIGKARKLSLSHAALVAKYHSYKTDSEVESTFLKFAVQFYADYLNTLENTGNDDFDGLIQKASQIISNGKNTFETKNFTGNLSNLKYIFVDEYQDFSQLFNELIQSIKKIATQADFFCVGDDWQAINGFAGSNLEYFSNIGAYIDAPIKLTITTNYRSPLPIVDIGNKLMQGLGQPAKTNSHAECTLNLVDLSTFEPTILEREKHSGDILTPAVLRLINQSLQNEQDVVLICRKNAINGYIFEAASKVNLGNTKGLERYLTFIRSFFPENLHSKITISTAHKYKGLEKPTVIVMELIKRNYPLVHPDWVFHRLFDNNLEQIIDEERRLLYVALTRAENNLFIITDKKEPSPFLTNIQTSTFMQNIEWQQYPPFTTDEQASRITVHVKNRGYAETGGTFAIRDLLKACNYKWQPTTNSWVKTFPQDEFNINILQNEIWFPQASNIEIHALGDNNVRLGRWHTN
ncbi:UvrD-helicase domain-containing protein [Shewanella sp. AC34-MNA-CIBAN-0136]|uniref:UvrD-helicase domain-containing protein n=1 Tax=Shewanella sp. AC34-MNA-CIBAN-0136 TaxID=3140463 RepID=UPI00332ADD44